MPKRKIGKITPNGVELEKHEIATVFFLAEQGYNIELLKPSRRKGSRTPDIAMDDAKWEMKSPKGKSSRTIENNFRTAVRQSSHIIFDLRRMKLPAEVLINKLEKEFILRKKTKRLIVITKVGKMLDFKK